MNRKDFVKKSVAGVATVIATKTVMGNSTSQQDNRTDDIVGFNHLPAPKDTNMNTVLHKANTRGNESRMAKLVSFFQLCELLQSRANGLWKITRP